MSSEKNVFVLNNMNEHPIDFSFLPPGSVELLEQNAKMSNPRITRSEVMFALHNAYRRFYSISRYDPTSLRPNAMIQQNVDINLIMSEAAKSMSTPAVYRSASVQSVVDKWKRAQFQDTHDTRTLSTNREKSFDRMNVYMHPQ